MVKLKPSELWSFYGAPGSGKSTLAAFFAQRYLTAGIPVFSNLPISGCFHFSKSDLGKFDISDCLLLWDEVGVDANSRNFKNNFSLENIEFLKYHRHERCQIMVFSQGFDDADKIIRTLSTASFVVDKFSFFVRFRKISKRPSINPDTRKPDDLYDFVPFSSRFIFAPRYWKYFNSFSSLNLPKKDFDLF